MTQRTVLEVDHLLDEGTAIDVPRVENIFALQRTMNEHPARLQPRIDHGGQAGLTELDHVDFLLKGGQPLGEVDTNEGKTDHLSCGVLEGQIASHVIATEQLGTSGKGGARHHRGKGRMLVAQRSTDGPLTVLLFQRGRHPEKIVAMADEHRGNRMRVAGGGAVRSFR